MLFFYLKSAARNLSRKRFFSVLNIAGLAVGICIFLLGLEFYRYEQGFNRFHPNLDYLYRVVIETPEGKTGSSFPTIGPLMERQLAGVHRAIRFGDNFNDGAIVAYQPPGGLPLRSFREDGCVFVDPAFLDAFHFPLMEGQNRLTETNSVVVTTAAAQQLFGAEPAIGKLVRLHNQFGDLPLTVTGVVADPPDQSDIKFRFLLPIRTLDDPVYTAGSNWAKLTTWGNDAYTTFLWLDNNADPRRIAAEATKLWQQNDPDYGKKKGHVRLQPVADMHLGQGRKEEGPTYSSFGLTATVLLLGFLILAIAWINYINFSTADALTRAREIGIHKVAGSSRFQIVCRSVTEGVLLNLLSVLLAFPMARLTQQLFNYITDRPLSLYYVNDLSSWLLILVVLATGSALGGGYTGILLSRLQPVTALQFNHPSHVGHSLVRKVLVVFQLTISCVFIGVTLVAWQQIRFMKRHDLGMDIDKLIVIQGPALRDSTFRSRSVTFRNDVALLPFVERFTSSGSAPGIGSGHNYSSDGVTGALARPGDEKVEYSISEVDEHFFETYGIPILYGSNFTAADATRNYKGDRLMINEKAARALGYEPAAAVGAVVHWDKAYTIVGVVRDYHHRSLKDPIEPILFVPQHNNSCYTIKTDPKNLREKLAVIRDKYEAAYPGNTFTYVSVRESYDRQYADQQRTGVIALSLSALIIAISSLGLIGLAAFTARRRTKEMGIRKVLGASVASLFLNLSAEYLWLVAIALLVATPLSWMISHRWLQEFAFRISPGWSIWLTAGFLCGLFTFLTVSFHALRTAFVNVISQLRTE
jgi:putative ABC transport system permease protein